MRVLEGIGDRRGEAVSLRGWTRYPTCGNEIIVMAIWPYSIQLY